MKKAGADKHMVYLAPEAYAFVTKDIEGLSSRGVNVSVHLFKATRAMALPAAFLRQLVFLRQARRLGASHAFAHFAGYHTLLPILLGYKVHIIIAGADACSFPGIGYGSFRKPIMRAAIAFSLRRASTLLPVHASLRRFTNDFSNYGPREQGYGAFVDGLATKELPLAYGFEAASWGNCRGTDQREGVICVAMGAVNGNSIHFRKGVDLIAEAARAMPDIRFTVIGSAAPDSYAGAPSNMQVRGRVSQSELRELYCTHSIYLQPSVMEGFPNALCEAMLSGCIPVVSDITSMPSIVGDPDLVVKRRTAAELIAAISRLIALTGTELQLERTRSVERAKSFPMDSRIAALLSVVGIEQ